MPDKVAPFLAALLALALPLAAQPNQTPDSQTPVERIAEAFSGRKSNDKAKVIVDAATEIAKEADKDLEKRIDALEGLLLGERIGELEKEVGIGENEGDPREGTRIDRAIMRPEREDWKVLAPLLALALGVVGFVGRWMVRGFVASLTGTS